MGKAGLCQVPAVRQVFLEPAGRCVDDHTEIPVLLCQSRHGAVWHGQHRPAQLAHHCEASGSPWGADIIV